MTLYLVECNTLSGDQYATRHKAEPSPLHTFPQTAVLEDEKIQLNIVIIAKNILLTGKRGYYRFFCKYFRVIQILS